MARRRVTDEEWATLDGPAPLTAEQFAGKSPSERPKRPPRVSPGAQAKLYEEARIMLDEGDWTAARPGHLVALYALAHEKVYGFLPSAELGDGGAFFMAQQAAAKLVERSFGGDAQRAVEFVRWCWAREEGREKWRRENKRGGQRIGWRLQFAGALVDDFRADALRRPGRP